MLSLYLRNASFIEAYIELHVSGTIAEIAGVKTRYKNSRRSRIFLKRGPLSCEVPSQRDSVGGG